MTDLIVPGDSLANGNAAAPTGGGAGSRHPRPVGGEAEAEADSSGPDGPAPDGPVPAGTSLIDAWPGELRRLDVGDVFVRRTPVPPGSQPALFVHGLGGSALNWTDLMGLLIRPAPAPLHYPAVAPLRPLAGEALDLPGFGFSPPPQNQDYSLDARVAAVVAVITDRGAGPVHLIGNSLGGAVCTRVAARRPDLVRSVTLISPALPDLRPRLLPLRLLVATVPGVGRYLVTKMLTLPPERRADTSAAELFVDPGRILPQRRAEAIAELIRRDALDYSVDALLGSARSLVTEYTRPPSASLWSDAAKVAAPTLLLHGSHDKLVNPAMAGRAARTFPNCRVVVLPRIGHVAMMERPDLVAAEMRTYLAGASGSDATGSDATGPAATGLAAAGPGAADGAGFVSGLIYRRHR